MADSYETKHGVRWRARWYDEEGNRFAKAGFRNRRSAEAYENDRDSDKRNMRAPDALSAARSRLTLDEWFEWWADNDGPTHVAPATYNSYTWAYKAHARKRIGDQRLRDLVTKPAILAGWRADVAAATDARTGKPLKATTRDGAAKALSAILSAAVAHGHLPSNPMYATVQGRRRRGRAAKMATIVQPAEPISLVAWCLLALALEDRSSRRDALDARRDAAMVRLGFMAGHRMPSEVVGVRWSDLRPNVIAVSGRVSEREWEPVTKTYELREVPMWTPLRNELEALKDAVTASSGTPPRNELIWHLRGSDGAAIPWSPSAMNNWRARHWRPAARLVAATWPEYAVIAEATPYQGRHAYVSICAAANLPLLQIARYAGHSVNMTEKIYGRIIAEQEGKPAMPPEDQIAAAQATAIKLYDASPPAPA